MNNSLHLDEKWFYVTIVSQWYYLVDGEDPPTRKTRQKSHIENFMFVCVVGCPHHYTNVDGQAGYFDGKIGIWPVGRFVEVERNSRNLENEHWSVKDCFRRHCLHLKVHLIS
jgi:hypothetical protein